MLKHNRTIAIVMAFVFCMSFLAPAFIAPSVAEAAFTASVSQSNNVASATGQNLGYFKVEVNVADWGAASGSQLLISFPTRLAAVAPSVGIGDKVSNVSEDIKIVVPEDGDNALSAAGTGTVRGLTLLNTSATNGSVFVMINPAAANSSKEKGWFYVHLTNIDTRNYAGDVNVNLVPQTGTAFGTTPQALVVGKVNVTGSTTTTVKSVEKITSGGGGLGEGQIDTITVFENMKNTIKAGNLTLTIVTKGYKWVDGNGAAKGLFNFATSLPGKGLSINEDEAILALTAAEVDGAVDNDAGAIAISGLRIKVDEKVAKVGQDIEVKVSGAGVTEQTIVVAQYVDFVANVIEDTTTELTAGLNGQKIGTFFIEEIAPNTLVTERTILFELPAGLVWHEYEKGTALASTNWEIVNNSAIQFSEGSFLDARTIKFTVTTTSKGAQNGAKVKFKGLKVDVSPSYRGEVVLNISGKAGVEGTAKVATVNPMITMTASAPEVNLGIKEQKVSDVEIVETTADTIVARHNGHDTSMAFYLDSGFRFAKIPKVEVIDGDMVLEVNDVKIQAPASGQNLLIIPIRAASYKTPAKIKISDIYVTADRNAPTGEVILYAADTSSYSNNVDWCNAFNNTHRSDFRYDTPASVAIAKNVTVPPVETKGTTGGGSGTFVIGSKIYTVNGLMKAMDVAPYIKNDRTYVPYRYLALALGVADEDIVWDAAAQKVTVTKGDTTVEAVIGSKTLTVNGSAVTMDVAPEITNDRTMLPARYLAEALGATVGWDPATQTVIFEM